MCLLFVEPQALQFDNMVLWPQVYNFDQWDKNRNPLFRHRPEPIKWFVLSVLQCSLEPAPPKQHVLV
jgi:hypothetical protein